MCIFRESVRDSLLEVRPDCLDAVLEEATGLNAENGGPHHGNEGYSFDTVLDSRA